MKKCLAVILSLVMLTGILSVAASAQGTDYDVSFAVASDLHFCLPEESLEWYSEDPVFGYANRRAAMENESGLIIDEFLRQCAEADDVEFVLISGDIVNDGRTVLEQHEIMAQKLADFEDETGKQVYVIDGNHDMGIYGEGTCVFGVEQWKQMYARFGYDEALTVRDDDCSYTADLGEKYRLIALDSCNQKESTEDGMTLDKINWVLDQAKLAKQAGRQPVLMMHHNLLDHLPFQRILSRNFIVKFHYSTAEFFADAGIKLVFTGHEHCSDATSFTSGYGNTIYDFATTSLTMYPLQYRVFNMNDDEIKYEARTVDKIDTAALKALVPDYTDEQLAAMDAGLNDFAKEYLKNGVEYRLELSMSEEKLGVSPDSIFYNLVMTAVGGLLDICNMPINGEGGSRELAAQYGFEIPECDYKDGWDLATELVAAHYGGSEAFMLDSTEIKTLLRLVVLILRTDFAAIADNTLLAAGNAMFEHFGLAPVADKITRMACEEFGAINNADYFILSVISPLLVSFACDDEVDDNNGVLEGYGAVEIEETPDYGYPESINSFIALIEKILHYISRIFDAFDALMK